MVAKVSKNLHRVFNMPTYFHSAIPYFWSKNSQTQKTTLKLLQKRLYPCLEMGMEINSCLLLRKQVHDQLIIEREQTTLFQNITTIPFSNTKCMKVSNPGPCITMWRYGPERGRQSMVWCHRSNCWQLAAHDRKNWRVKRSNTTIIRSLKFLTTTSIIGDSLAVIRPLCG